MQHYQNYFKYFKKTFLSGVILSAMSLSMAAHANDLLNQTDIAGISFNDTIAQAIYKMKKANSHLEFRTLKTTDGALYGVIALDPTSTTTHHRQPVGEEFFAKATLDGKVALLTRTVYPEKDKTFTVEKLQEALITKYGNSSMGEFNPNQHLGWDYDKNGVQVDLGNQKSCGASKFSSDSEGIAINRETYRVMTKDIDMLGDNCLLKVEAYFDIKDDFVDYYTVTMANVKQMYEDAIESNKRQAENEENKKVYLNEAVDKLGGPKL